MFYVLFNRVLSDLFLLNVGLMFNFAILISDFLHVFLCGVHQPNLKMKLFSCFVGVAICDALVVIEWAVCRLCYGLADVIFCLERQRVRMKLN